jgi:hypothetical protein
MITHHIVNRIFRCKGHKCKRRVLFSLAAAAVTLILVGNVLEHGKAVECGLTWLFEQFIGGAKAALTDSNKEE